MSIVAATSCHEKEIDWRERARERERERKKEDKTLIAHNFGVHYDHEGCGLLLLKNLTFL